MHKEEFISINSLDNSSIQDKYNASINGNDTSSESDGCGVYSFVISTVFIGTVCITGLITNLLSYAIFAADNIKTSTSFLFQSLAISDSILLITVFPLYPVSTFAKYTGLIPEYFQIQPYILVYLFPCAFTAQTFTIWVTVLVGVNRFLAVGRPYKTRLSSLREAKLQLACVLVCVILYCLPKFLEAAIVWETRDNVTFTAKAEHTDMANHRWYNIIYSNVMYTIFLLVLPLLILVVLNIRLLAVLKEFQKRSQRSSKSQARDNNVTLVLVIVMVVFVVCQLPALVNQILWNALSDQERECGYFHYYFSRLSNALVILNSAVYFFIHIAFNTRFKYIMQRFRHDGLRGAYLSVKNENVRLRVASGDTNRDDVAHEASNTLNEKMGNRP